MEGIEATPKRVPEESETHGGATPFLLSKPTEDVVPLSRDTTLILGHGYCRTPNAIRNVPIFFTTAGDFPTDLHHANPPAFEESPDTHCNICHRKDPHLTNGIGTKLN